jgi:hypothetical protein
MVIISSSGIYIDFQKQLEQVKKDSFEFPGFIQLPTLNGASIAHSSHVVLKMRHHFCAKQGFVHSVECPGEYFLLKTANNPRRRRRLFPILLGGTKQLSEFQSTYYQDDTIDDSRMTDVLRVKQYNHIVGDLYFMDTEKDSQHTGHVVDINTKNVIRTTEANKSGIRADILLADILVHENIDDNGQYKSKDMLLAIQEFGAL